MNHDAPAPTNPPPPAPAINYLKLTASLMAVVAFWQITENWDDFKTGFGGGYHDARQQTSR